MINSNYTFNSLLVETGLIAKCLWNVDPKIIIRNASALACVSKNFRDCISSKIFFDYLVRSIEPDIELLEKNSSSEPVEVNGSFKKKYTHLRTSYSKNLEDFYGDYFADVWVNKDLEVELVFFNQKIQCVQLKKDSNIKELIIPEALRVPSRSHSREFPFAVRSEKYLAINQRYDSAIYIYSSTDNKCLKRYLVEGDICQVVIQGEFLYVMQNNTQGECKLKVFNLQQEFLQNTNEIDLPKNAKKFPPPTPICFGSNYIAYTQHLQQGYQLHFLPISCLNSYPIDSKELPWIQGPVWDCFPYILTHNEGFLGMSIEKDKRHMIKKIDLSSQGIVETVIASSVNELRKHLGYCQDVCVHRDRIYFALEKNNSTTHIYSYDMLLDSTSHVGDIPMYGSNHPFHPRFVATATKLHYVVIGIKQNPSSSGFMMTSSLFTLKYLKGFNDNQKT